MEKLLKKIGLDDKESTIYLACLKNDFNSPVSLARQTRLKRSTVYFYLEKLLQKGLINYKIKGKRKNIIAVSPHKALSDYIAIKDENTKREKKAIQSLIPKLMQILKERTETTQVHLYEGKAGIHAVIDALIKENKDNYWFGSVDNFTDIISEEEIYRRLTLPRMKQKTTGFGITDRRVLGKKRTSERLGNFREFRFLEKKLNTPAGLMFFGDYTSITVKHNKEVKVILIKDPLVTQLIRTMFMLLWDKLPER